MEALLEKVEAGHRPSHEEALGLAEGSALAPLIASAASLRDLGHQGVVSYSRKVFIPLTQL